MPDAEGTEQPCPACLLSKERNELFPGWVVRGRRDDFHHTPQPSMGPVELMALFDLGSSRIQYSFFHSFSKHAHGAQSPVLYAFGIRNKSVLPSVDRGTKLGEPGCPRNDGERDADCGAEFGDREETRAPAALAV